MNKYEENVGPHDALTSENATLLLIDHQVGLMQFGTRYDSRGVSQ